MVNVIERFLEDEICSQELYDAIIDFIVSPHIRNGEFEANYFVIKKMDVNNFFIFPEDIFPDNSRGISYCASCYKVDLISKINKYAEEKGIKIKLNSR